MLQLRFLGTARIEADGVRIEGKSAQRHRLALLAQLACARGGAMPRERLMTALWPEQGAPQARHLLNVSVHVLRKELGEAVLLTEGNDVRLNADVAACDVLAFREALRVRDFAAAVGAYGGAFLDGFALPGAAEFEQWQEEERAALATEYARALEGLAAAAEGAGDQRTAIDAWRRLAQRAPDDGSVVVRLMRALDASGDRTGALRAADAHVAYMAREFEEQPHGDVVREVESLRARPSRPVVLAPSAAVPAEPDAPIVPAAPPAPIPTPRSRSTRRRVIGFALLAAVAAAFTVLVPVSTAEDDPAAPHPASVAVLPFVDMSEGRDKAYLSDGLTEELLNALARIEGMRVAARSSSFQYRTPGVDVRRVGRELGVAAVVEGSVRLDGDALRVTAQLIDTRTGFHLWSDQYDRTLGDAFAVQEEIARDVSAALGAELVRGIPDTLVARATAVPEAYDAYLRGRHEWNRRTRDGMLAAVAAFERAVALDPRYAVAYAGLADAWQLLPDYADVPAAEGLARAKTAALRAIALDSTLASAWASLGALLDDYDRDRAGAERAYRRAIALNPGYSTARQWLAIHIADEGRFDEALAEIERSRRLAPNAEIINTAVGAVRYFARDLEGSIAEYRAVVDRNPDFAIAWALLGRTLLVSGRVPEAVEALERSITLSGGDPSYRAVYAAALAAAGRDAEARRVAREVEGVPAGGYVPLTELAGAWVYIGDDEKALSLFERAFDERDPAVKHMKVEPLYDRIRTHPRFQAVLRRAGHAAVSALPGTSPD